MSDMKWIAELDEVGDVLLSKFSYLEDLRNKIAEIENEINFVESELIKDVEELWSKAEIKEAKNRYKHRNTPS